MNKIELKTHNFIKKRAEKGMTLDPVACFVSIDVFADLINEYISLVGQPSQPNLDSVEITTSYGAINVYPTLDLSGTEVILSVPYIVDSEEVNR